MSDPVWKYFTKQSEWKSYLQDLVKKNDQACLRAIVLIDGWQTEVEKQQQESTEENGVGWTKYDAKEMGAIADKIRKGEQLTDGELAKSKNKMQKYWKQLMYISQKQQEQREKEHAEQLRQQKLKQFKQALETIRKCAEDKVMCEYGICDECPLTRGYQMRINTEESKCGG